MRRTPRRTTDEGYVPPRPADPHVAVDKEEQPCRKCGTLVVKKITKSKPRGNRAFFFEYVLFCPKCRTVYMVESAKRDFPEEEGLFS